MSGPTTTDPATRPIWRLADSLSRRRRPKRQRRALPDGVALGDDHAVKKRPPRVHGPYAEPDGYRIILVTDGSRKSLKFPTEDLAEAAKAQLLGQIRDTQARTIGDALDEYRDALVHERGNLPQTAADTHRRLAMLLPTAAAIKSLTTELASDCYRRAGERASRTGRKQSAATLAFVLKAARRFGAFCVERGYLSQNPYAKPDKHQTASFKKLHMWYKTDAPQKEQDKLAPAEAVKSFDEVIHGLTEAEARFEAQRCLSCGNCFECDGCFGACPEDAIIKLGKGNRYKFNYEACTGCAVCYEQCPCHAIEMIPEPVNAVSHAK